MVSVYGYVKLTPLLDKWGLHDTCGIHNLHGMPGIIGSLGGVISATLATKSVRCWLPDCLALAFGENYSIRLVPGSCFSGLR